MESRSPDFPEAGKKHTCPGVFRVKFPMDGKNFPTIGTSVVKTPRPWKIRRPNFQTLETECRIFTRFQLTTGN
jgi:hypothetical protein